MTQMVQCTAGISVPRQSLLRNMRTKKPQMTPMKSMTQMVQRSIGISVPLQNHL